jgi:hypothetical protein
MRDGDSYAGGASKDVKLLVDAGHWGSLAGGMLGPLRHVVSPGLPQRKASRPSEHIDLDQMGQLSRRKEMTLAINRYIIYHRLGIIYHKAGSKCHRLNTGFRADGAK